MKTTTTIKSEKDAIATCGSLSAPSKMPCHGYSIPAKRCLVGMKMRNVKNSVCASCYAMKGRYGFGNVQDAMERRFQSLENPLWEDAMVFLIQSAGNTYFRWHDSGDLQGTWHLEKICNIARRLPSVNFWLPTREYAIVSKYISDGGEIPQNLTVRLSALMIDGPAPEGMAKRLGLVVSGVSKDQSFTCPASSQGNKCNLCRACWDKSTFNVTYPKH